MVCFFDLYVWYVCCFVEYFLVMVFECFLYVIVIDCVLVSGNFFVFFFYVIVYVENVMLSVFLLLVKYLRCFG